MWMFNINLIFAKNADEKKHQWTLNQCTKMFFQQHAFETVWKLMNLMPIKIYI